MTHLTPASQEAIGRAAGRLALLFEKLTVLRRQEAAAPEHDHLETARLTEAAVEFSVEVLEMFRDPAETMNLGDIFKQVYNRRSGP